MYFLIIIFVALWIYVFWLIYQCVLWFKRHEEPNTTPATANGTTLQNTTPTPATQRYNATTLVERAVLNGVGQDGLDFDRAHQLNGGEQRYKLRITNEDESRNYFEWDVDKV